MTNRPRMFPLISSLPRGDDGCPCAFAFPGVWQGRSGPLRQSSSRVHAGRSSQLLKTAVAMALCAACHPNAAAQALPGSGGDGSAHTGTPVAGGGAPGQAGANGISNFVGAMVVTFGAGAGGGGAGAAGGAGGDGASILTPVIPGFPGGAGGVAGVNQGRGGDGGSDPWRVSGGGGGGGGAICFSGSADDWSPAADCIGGDGGHGGHASIGGGGGGGGGHALALLGGTSATLSGALVGGQPGHGGSGTSFFLTDGIYGSVSTGFADGSAGGAGASVRVEAELSLVVAGSVRGGAGGDAALPLSLPGRDGADGSNGDGTHGCADGEHGRLLGESGGDLAGGPTGDGGPGIWLLEMAELYNDGTIEGGAGGAGSEPGQWLSGNGGRGGNGQARNDSPGENGCRGGNGSDGSDNRDGRAGRTGGTGIQALAGASITNRSDMVGGNGGVGGRGGTGGSGGNGGSGGEGGLGTVGGYTVRGDGGDGGNGGAGGDGGNGGAGGQGGHAVELASGVLYQESGGYLGGGLGGPGGIGGLPGEGGSGGPGSWGGPPGSAGDGTPGRNGARGSGGTGGAGGDGGDAVILRGSGTMLSNHGEINHYDPANHPDRIDAEGGAGGRGLDSFTEANAGDGGAGGNGGIGVALDDHALLVSDGSIDGGWGGQGAAGGDSHPPPDVLACFIGTTCSPGTGGDAGRGGTGIRASGQSIVQLEGGGVFGGLGGSGGLSGAGGRDTGGRGGDGGTGIELDHAELRVPANGSPNTVYGGNAGRSPNSTDGRGGILEGGRGGDALVASDAAVHLYETASFQGGIPASGVDASEAPVSLGQPRISGGNGQRGGNGAYLTQGSSLQGVGQFIGMSGGWGGAGLPVDTNGAHGGNGGGSGHGIDAVESSVELLAGSVVRGNPGGRGGACRGNHFRGGEPNRSGDGGNGGHGLRLAGAEGVFRGQATGGDGGVAGALEGSCAVPGGLPPLPGMPGSPGAGGSGIVLNGGARLVFSGSASGGFRGGATAESDRAPAIALHNGGNTLQLQPGWSATGRVVSDSGSTNGGDTLVLGGNSAFIGFELAGLNPGGRFDGFSKLTKLGPGTWQLWGTESSFAGPTTITEGTLQLDGSLPDSTIEVLGGRLAGQGNAGPVRLASGAGIAAGTVHTPVGQLTLSALEWKAGGFLELELGASAASSDRLAIEGALTKSGSGVFELRFADGSSPTIGETYTLLTFAANTGFAEEDFSFSHAGSGDVHGRFQLDEDALRFVSTATAVHTIGGTVSGLLGSGLELKLNGGEPLPVAANGSYEFPDWLPAGSDWTVSIASQPTSPQQYCVASPASGEDIDEDIHDVAVTCAEGTAVLGGTASNQQDYARYGQMLDYELILHNTGNVAFNGLHITSVLSPGLDVASASWVCSGDAGVQCGSGGVGPVQASDVVIPAGASATWLLSVPVRVDAPGATVETRFEVSGSDELTLTDTDVLVLLRDGFDGVDTDEIVKDSMVEEACAAPAPTDAERGAQAPDIYTGAPYLFALAPLPPSRTVRTELEMKAGTSARLRVERLSLGARLGVRLVTIDMLGQEYGSPWASTVIGAPMAMGLVEWPADGIQRGEQAAILLEGASSPLMVPLDPRTVGQPPLAPLTPLVPAHRTECRSDG